MRAPKGRVDTRILHKMISAIAPIPMGIKADERPHALHTYERLGLWAERPHLLCTQMPRDWASEAGRRIPML